MGNPLLEKFLKPKNEVNVVRTLYLVMEKVGGYEVLMNLPIPVLQEIIKCMEWEAREQNKAMRKK
ncbi:hypothetical protein DRN69_05160 [Candidatus Pacearchaeota archaeon]|nr:MAG: hypothetical protein DRN69_05160 [Candidatus Pacearchaeota archaeon]